MNIDEIKELIEILNNTDIAELCVESEGVKISIKKGSAWQAAIAPLSLRPSKRPGGGSARTRCGGRGRSGARRRRSVRQGDGSDGRHLLPGPGARRGALRFRRRHRRSGTTLVHHRGDEADERDRVRGDGARIVKILVENGQPVEYGQPLFLIEPDELRPSSSRRPSLVSKRFSSPIGAKSPCG